MVTQLGGDVTALGLIVNLTRVNRQVSRSGLAIALPDLLNYRSPYKP